MSLATWVGCGTIVANAGTRGRPDTVEPADLLGPYEGQVVEQASGKPIAGALVVGSFGYAKGMGLRAPAGADVVEANSDADGRYRLVAPASLPTGPSVRLDRFTLIVYQRGFVAYRSDRRLEGNDVLLRRDFSQRGNVVRLAKLDPAMGHARHLAFLGVWGGPPRLAKALAWEFEEAVKHPPDAGPTGAPR